MLCSSLGKSLMRACVRHKRHSEIQKGRQRAECPVCTALHVHMGLFTSNSCRRKPPINDYCRDQLKAVNVYARWREREREREREQAREREGEGRTCSETGPMSKVTGGAAQLKTTCPPNDA